MSGSVTLAWIITGAAVWVMASIFDLRDVRFATVRACFTALALSFVLLVAYWPIYLYVTVHRSRR